MHERHQQYLANLTRRADDAVARHGLMGVRAEVVLIVDTSKSMYAMYQNNMVAELATRLLALSLELDDDGVIPAYAFGDRCRHLGDLSVDDFAGWVEREVIRTGSDFQNGCKYAPVINDVCSYFFPEDWHQPTSEVKVGRIFKKVETRYPTLSAPRALPVYALFVTGGECQDEAATTDAIRRSSRLPIFWQFIGLQSGKGQPTRFDFLRRLDTLGNTHVDNCGFFEASDTRNDALLFEGMCRELPSYLERREVQEMLLAEELGGLRTKGERASGKPRTKPKKSREISKLQTTAEPTSELGAHQSRTLKALQETRPAVAVEPSKRMARAEAPAEPDPGSEAAARRARRVRLANAEPIPEAELPAPPKRRYAGVKPTSRPIEPPAPAAESTVIISAAPDDEETQSEQAPDIQEAATRMVHARDLRQEPTRIVQTRDLQDESTRMVDAHDADDDGEVDPQEEPTRLVHAQDDHDSPEARLAAMRARRRRR